MIDALTDVLSAAFAWGSRHPWWFVLLWPIAEVTTQAFGSAVWRAIKRRVGLPRLTWERSP